MNFPTNIADRENATDNLHSILSSMPGPIAYHICDGRKLFHEIAPEEFVSVCDSIAKCSLVFVLEDTRSRLEPIAAFIANESLRNAKLYHLIDDKPSTRENKLPRDTALMLGLYIGSLFASCDWLDVVTVPAGIESIQGLFGLSVVVDGDEMSHVRLQDAGHRP